MRLLIALSILAGLAGASVSVGVGDVSLGGLLTAAERDRTVLLLLESRVPRTLALILAGAAMPVAGLIMQMLARNRFVEPATTGTVEFASLGVLATMVVWPGLPVMGRMVVAASFALAGTALFLFILSRIPLRSVLVVPLVGIMLGGVAGALATFFAYRYDLTQSLAAWTMGDFSHVLRGRYELLWIAAAVTGAAYFAADRFTLAGMGRDTATNLGLDYGQVVFCGLVVIAMVSAAVVTTVGSVPFLGLIVPNIVSLAFGDNGRRTIPWIAILGSAIVLACDVAGRLIRYPFEIPVGVVLGVVGSAAFLFLLLRKDGRLA